MPFSQCRHSSASWTLQGLSFLFVYLGDILVASAEEHLSHLQQFFEWLDEHGLIVNPVKCQYGLLDIDCLGHLPAGSCAVVRQSGNSCCSPLPRTIKPSLHCSRSPPFWPPCVKRSSGCRKWYSKAMGTCFFVMSPPVVCSLQTASYVFVDHHSRKSRVMRPPLWVGDCLVAHVWWEEVVVVIESILCVEEGRAVWWDWGMFFFSHTRIDCDCGDFSCRSVHICASS